MPDIRALTFDLFGTIFAYPEGCPWVHAYAAAVYAIAQGKRPYQPIGEIFDYVGADFGDLSVRPGVAEALARLEKLYTVAPLSNASGPVALALAGRFGLSWSLFIDTETAGTYKPDPRFYCLAARRLEMDPHRILHVAAHKFDLIGARAMGFRTAFLRWPGYVTDPFVPGAFDYQAESLSELADLLLGVSKPD